MMDGGSMVMDGGSMVLALYILACNGLTRILKLSFQSSLSCRPLYSYQRYHSPKAQLSAHADS